ncbi:peptidoglycan/LPS O-acetylase OafA/YrhL [Azospirillum fermentarium]|uniref:acyltransferase family protein n=1 Tax=Azospirillum fermentarium TaxID=1233114 RepID=UPI0022277735|nr:acyltransferase [Azospirillum fermentarium]MCW2247183.1 peptidoglycan/LPS O-acetylase OafA/YrhL [Azospirillum fermentarium]
MAQNMAQTENHSGFSHSAPIEIIQLYRAIAAIAVFMYHAYIFSNAFLLIKSPDWFRFIFGHGKYGVDFFFTLSGFIILNAHYQDQDTLASSKRYALKRGIRIFPAYLPISIISLIVYSLDPNIGLKTKENISIISSLFLIPSSGHPALSAAWTLIHETIFYTIFLAYFFWRKAFFAIIGLWALIMALNVLLPLGLASNAVSAKVLSPINLEFIGGLICAFVWRRVNAGTATGIALLLSGVAGLVVVVGTGFITNVHHRWILGIPFALILLGGCYLEKGRGLNMPRPALALGDASYALYLIHAPLISVMFRVVPGINRSLGALGPAAEWAVTVSLTAGLCILAALLYHRLYERPVLSFLHARMLSP